jgi:hypothetical protein
MSVYRTLLYVYGDSRLEVIAMQPTPPDDRPATPAQTVNIPVLAGPVDLGPRDFVTVEERPLRPEHFGAEFSRCG